MSPEAITWMRSPLLEAVAGGVAVGPVAVPKLVVPFGLFAPVGTGPPASEPEGRAVPVVVPVAAVVAGPRAIPFTNLGAPVAEDAVDAVPVPVPVGAAKLSPFPLPAGVEPDGTKGGCVRTVPSALFDARPVLFAPLVPLVPVTPVGVGVLVVVTGDVVAEPGTVGDNVSVGGVITELEVEDAPVSFAAVDFKLLGAVGAADM